MVGQVPRVQSICKPKVWKSLIYPQFISVKVHSTQSAFTSPPAQKMPDFSIYQLVFSQFQLPTFALGFQNERNMHGL